MGGVFERGSTQAMSFTNNFMQRGLKYLPKKAFIIWQRKHGEKKTDAKALWKKRSKDREFFIIEDGVLKVGCKLATTKIEQKGTRTEQGTAIDADLNTIAI